MQLEIKSIFAIYSCLLFSMYLNIHVLLCMCIFHLSKFWCIHIETTVKMYCIISYCTMQAETSKLWSLNGLCCSPFLHLQFISLLKSQLFCDLFYIVLWTLYNMYCTYLPWVSDWDLIKSGRHIDSSFNYRNFLPQCNNTSQLFQVCSFETRKICSITWSAVLFFTLHVT